MFSKCVLSNSVNPDQTAPEEQSDHGFHCLPRHICSNTEGRYSSYQFPQVSRNQLYTIAIETDKKLCSLQ